MKAYASWNTALFVGAAMAAAAVGGFLAVRTTGIAWSDERIGVAPSVGDPTTIDDEKALQKVQAGYVKAFNSGNAKDLAAFWAEDGEFTDADGRTLRGRSAIEKDFTTFFAESKGVKLEVNTDSLRFVSPGVALETGTSRLLRPTDGASNIAGYNIVHTKRDGQWQLASVRETPYTPSSNYDHLRDLEWLVGTWSAKSGGQSLELSCEWTAKRNFLLRKYSSQTADGATKTGVQIIGWDPKVGGIRSWVFDSDGGFGSERWIKDGQHWVLEASGVARDGATIIATNILSPIDHDNFTWQSVRRSLGQTRLADTALVKVTREKAKK